jgi:hypothetical protein
MQTATTEGIGAVSSPGDWIKDFLAAVRPLNPYWVEPYWINKKQNIQDGSLSFRLVAQDFRDSMNRMGTSQSKIAKGSFGPTYKPNGDGRNASVYSDSNENVPVPTRRPQKRKRNPEDYGSLEKSKRNNPGPLRTTRDCQACGQLHDWRHYFYLVTNVAKRSELE